MMRIFKEYPGYYAHYTITCVILALFIYYYNILNILNELLFLYFKFPFLFWWEFLRISRPLFKI